MAQQLQLGQTLLQHVAKVGVAQVHERASQGSLQQQAIGFVLQGHAVDGVEAKVAFGPAVGPRGSDATVSDKTLGLPPHRLATSFGVSPIVS